MPRNLGELGVMFSGEEVRELIQKYESSLAGLREENEKMKREMMIMAGTRRTFGNKNYDLVYQMIRQIEGEHGCNSDSIFLALQVQGGINISKTEIGIALDFLSSEGHIYSSFDEEHFKITDCCTCQ